MALQTAGGASGESGRAGYNHPARFSPHFMPIAISRATEAMRVLTTVQFYFLTVAKLLYFSASVFFICEMGTVIAPPLGQLGGLDGLVPDTHWDTHMAASLSLAETWRWCSSESITLYR